jgi:23S rRNA-intervening sequence protein
MKQCWRVYQFISHAKCSVAELDTQLVIAVDLGYCKSTEAEVVLALISELRKMLNRCAEVLCKNTTSYERSLVTHHCFMERSLITRHSSLLYDA